MAGKPRNTPHDKSKQESGFRKYVREAAKPVREWPEWKRVYGLNHGSQRVK